MRKFPPFAQNAQETLELAIELAKIGDLAAAIEAKLGDSDASETTDETEKSRELFGTTAITAEKAAEIATDIEAGIQEFDETYKEASADEGELDTLIAGIIDDALTDKTDEEQRTALSAVVTAIGGEPDDLTIEDLKKEVANYVDNFALMELGIGDDAADALLKLGFEAGDALCDLALRGNSRKYVAAALYILREKGELPELPNELDAKTIGTLTAAAAAADDVVKEGAAGRIPWEKVKAILRLIAVVAAVIVLAVFLKYLASLAYVIALEIACALPLLFLSVEVIQVVVTLGLVMAAIGIVAGAMAIAQKLTGFAAPITSIVAELWGKVKEWVRYRRVAAKARAAAHADGAQEDHGYYEFDIEDEEGEFDDEDEMDELEEGAQPEGEPILA
jgi:hypothetical protein